MSLKMPEQTVLTVPGFSIIRNIAIITFIIVTVMILEFLSTARFVHPGALLPFYLYLTRVAA